MWGAWGQQQWCGPSQINGLSVARNLYLRKQNTKQWLSPEVRYRHCRETAEAWGGAVTPKGNKLEPTVWQLRWKSPSSKARQQKERGF